MASVNKAIILGNLGVDPEVRYTANKDAVCNLSIATNKKWKDKETGELQERTEWHRVVVWGATAEACGEYLNKGSQVYVEGELQTRKWTDKDTIERYSTEIIASNVVFLGAGDKGAKDKAPSEREETRRAPVKKSRR